jgi:hypothetical protein
MGIDVVPLRHALLESARLQREPCVIRLGAVLAP